ncbi:hypothetical protein EGJ15_25210 [Pseudomonas sp. p99-361]|nr:hypothetical protein EGJ15_25210 [Pseudomonas sp. p99-361]
MPGNGHTDNRHHLLLQRFEGCQIPLHQFLSVPARHRIRWATAAAKLAFIHVRTQRIDLKSRRVGVGPII